MDANQIINRFDTLNRTRIERLSKLVSLQQQPFFKLFPFLLHTNLPDLPGYGDKNTPVGIIDYQADDKTLNEAQKLSNNFKYKRHGIRHFGLAGIYLVNHYGLLNIPDQLTFTVYVVHTGITAEQLQALNHKLKLLTQWTKSLNITLNIQLLNEQKLHLDPLPADQLEELYLNGLILAGGNPFWWLVPPDEDYQQIKIQFSQQRTQIHNHLLDFGDITPITAQTLVTQTSNMLSQSLDAGLTHILPLLYRQHLFEQFPDTTPLSNNYKTAVYEGEREPLNIDCKVLQFIQITNGKLTAESKRLAQQSLYTQSDEALSKRVSQPKYPWRRDFIKNKSQNWSWPSHEFQILDHRDNAKYQQCLEEHEQTQVAFNQIQNRLKRFTSEHQLTLPDDSNQIDKKLQAYTDKKPNIIDSLPPNLLAKSPEEEIHLYRFSNTGHWKLSLIPLSTETQKPLYQHDTLLHVLAWAVSNRLLSRATRILIADKTNLTTIKTAVSLAQQLLRSSLTEQAKPQHQTTENRPPSLDHLILIANLEQNEEALNNNPEGIQLTSLHNDPFNYANRGESLLYSIDSLFHTTNGEWQTFQTKGKTAPLVLFQHLSAWWQDNKITSSLLSWCPSEAHGPLISQRLKKLYLDVNTHYQKHIYGEYLIIIADSIYKFIWQPEGVDIAQLGTTRLELVINRSKSHFLVSKLDQQLDPKQLLNTLLGCQKKDTLSLIIEPGKTTVSIHFIDEFGNLISQYDLKLTPQTALVHFQYFLNSIQQHNPALSLRYFKVEPTQTVTKPWKLSAISPPSLHEKQSYLPVTINMASATNNADCTISCGPKLFSGQANDKSTFEQIATFILSLRKSNIPYPLYINEIRFNEPQNVSTMDYLTQKLRFEKQLNID
jgi:adenylate cyclase class 1